jgi:hypothetical protein
MQGAEKWGGRQNIDLMFSTNLKLLSKVKGNSIQNLIFFKVS